LSEGWEQISIDGEWPQGNTVTNNYDFTVMFKSNPLMEFSWSDYRGGAILERSTEKDVKDLQERIHGSECLIVCIGADAIKDIISGGSSRIREMRRLNSLIMQYAKENKRRIPIIFALTKADLYTVEDQKKLLGIIKTYFSSLYVEGAHWLHAIVPVTLGKIDNSWEDTKIHGTIAPKNIHIPVMFFLQSILKERIANIQKKLNGIKSDRETYHQEIINNQGRSWWDKLWNGDSTKKRKSEIESLNTDEKKLIGQLDELDQAFANMKDMFNVCKVYYDGQPVII